jgi:TolB-like protein/class 3 adenylate cyclase/Tfp pilus assembly protein PilF
MATTTTTRRLAAILAADVAGYSRLMGADEEGTYERLKAHLREVVDPTIREHHGRIVKTTGDGVLAEFASVVDAVRCAGEIQRAMAERDLDLPEVRRLRFRIGVNLGDVIADGGDIYGDGVNIAARLEALAAPGGICVSGTVYDHIGDRLPYTFDDLGKQKVKNIARPVRAYALRPAGVASSSAAGSRMRPFRCRRAFIGALVVVALVILGAAWWFSPAVTSLLGAGKLPNQAIASATPASASISQPRVVPRLSIVVLPFANLSNDPDQQYFADAITEDLTTDLSQRAHMFVTSANTAFTYRNKPVDTKQIGRELGVRYVLEGSVQRSANRVRVTAQLIDANTDAHLWAERFDRDIGDLLTLQDEITSRLANSLGIELLGREAARRTDNPDSLDYILRGRAARLRPNSREGYAEAVGFFERALTLNPRSIEAQTQLASALVGRVLDGMTDSAEADIARAEELIEHVLAVSPRNGYAHFVKGRVLWAQNRSEEAIPEFETALASDPNSVWLLHYLAIYKLLTGSIDEVIPLEERAIRLSPREPNIGYWYVEIGTVHLLQSRTDDAIAWLEKARSVLPAVPLVHIRLASAYALKGETERAAAELSEARRLRGKGSYSSIARMLDKGNWGVPKTRALFEATYFAGLRKAGIPEE